MNNRINYILEKVKKSNKLIVFIGLVVIILLLLLTSSFLKVNVKSVRQGELTNILAAIPIEYQVKKEDGDTYSILVIINSDAGIENVKYQNKDGQEIELKCYNKLSVGIDYEVEVNQEYYFIVKRVGQSPVTEKIYIERSIPQDGSQTYPYIIKTADQLQNINNKLDVYYKLGANIDLTGRTWQTIGNQTTPFKGELNGNGYTIKNLTINKDEDYIGLFGYNQGTLKNIKLENFSVTGKNNVGALVGYNTGIITNNNAVAQVTGNTNVGGLIGYTFANNTNMTAESLFVSGTVTGVSNVGGLIGNSSINNETYAENVTYSMYLKKSYSTAEVKGNTNVGGLVGIQQNSMKSYNNYDSVYNYIQECYATRKSHSNRK